MGENTRDVEVTRSPTVNEKTLRHLGSWRARNHDNKIPRKKRNEKQIVLCTRTLDIYKFEGRGPCTRRPHEEIDKHENRAQERR